MDSHMTDISQKSKVPIENQWEELLADYDWSCLLNDTKIIKFT